MQQAAHEQSENVQARATAKRVAVLCQQTRLRRLLRLSLVTAGYDVAEWGSQVGPADPDVAAVVVDLDSTGHDVPGALALLASWRVPEAAPVLFISVYPLDLPGLERSGPFAVLQPPFSPDALADWVRRLVAP
jgi:hypothetical protein